MAMYMQSETLSPQKIREMQLIFHGPKISFIEKHCFLKICFLVSIYIQVHMLIYYLLLHILGY